MLKMFVFGLFFNLFKLFLTALKNFEGFLRFLFFSEKDGFLSFFIIFGSFFYIYGLKVTILDPRQPSECLTKTNIRSNPLKYKQIHENTFCIQNPEPNRQHPRNL